MAKLPKGKTAIILGKTYRSDVPDSLVKYLPKGLIEKSDKSSTSTKKNDTTK